jgi:uroporphyrinogen III methyltransferase/synthase
MVRPTIRLEPVFGTMLSSVACSTLFTKVSQTDKKNLPSQAHNHSSVVFLVGAGPGDPGLITVRGAELLASANLVVYDALVNPQLLRHCPTSELIYVGKRAGQHSMTQDQINQLLVDHAKLGKRVVRLKGGDPFVFGRGGEECEALANAGIRFEVVPGITAAMAAPAYAGIPVTHRDFNSSFTFLTGHEKEEEFKDEHAKLRTPGAGSDIDWSAVAKLPCLAFYMGIKSLPRICAKLIEHGMPADTPAATIQWGTTPKQRTVVATIANLPARVTEEKIEAPAMTIIGKVVQLRQTMNWFERRPLFGQTIIVTRTREQSSELAQQLAALGANVLEAPTIELSPPTDQHEVDAVLSAMNYDWIIFTSANGVKHTKRRLFELGLDARAFGSAKIAAVGDVTASAVRDELALHVDLCPQTFVAEALADALTDQKQVEGKRFLLLRADIARPVLKERLEQFDAAAVRDLAIYETKPVTALPPEMSSALENGQVNWITFASSSAVRNFLALLGESGRAQLEKIRIASIGPITTETLRANKLEPAAIAKSSSIQGLLDAILESPGLP